MAGKATDRKGKNVRAAVDITDNTINFCLPDTLSCSEMQFPILIEKRPRVKWQDVLDESSAFMKEIKEFEDCKKDPIPKSPFLRTECDYLKNEIFVFLIPALEETLNKAKIWDALSRQKCFFNGVDHIAQVLWNNNPRHPERKVNDWHLFNMPWVRKELKENPRPYYPKSWLWPEDFAATMIQKTVRQYFVQREEDVQEMRDFWKKLEYEKNLPEIDTNPFLAKKFAALPRHKD